MFNINLIFIKRVFFIIFINSFFFEILQCTEIENKSLGKFLIEVQVKSYLQSGFNKHEISLFFLDEDRIYACEILAGLKDVKTKKVPNFSLYQLCCYRKNCPNINIRKKRLELSEINNTSNLSLEEIKIVKQLQGRALLKFLREQRIQKANKENL